MLLDLAQKIRSKLLELTWSKESVAIYLLHLFQSVNVTFWIKQNTPTKKDREYMV